MTDLNNNPSSSADLPIESPDAGSSLSLADVPMTSIGSYSSRQGRRQQEQVNLAAVAMTDEDSSSHLDDDVNIINHHENGGRTTTTNNGGEYVDHEIEGTTGAAVPRVSRWFYFGGICFVLVGALIVLIVALTINDQQESSLDRVLDYLVQQGVSKRETWNIFGTPQHRAALFLAMEEDAIQKIPRVSMNDPVDRSGYLYVARYVMAVVYFSLNGNHWKSRCNFLMTSAVCEWNDVRPQFIVEEVVNNPDGVTELGGVLCDTTGVPVVLDLEYNGLIGTIPTELGLLTTLQKIDMEYNEFISGSIPPELCQLTQLRYLSLVFNALTGSLPTCIGQWSNLLALRLENNFLTGTLPGGSELCSMTQMLSFILQRNTIHGTIPTCTGLWTNLDHWVMSDNHLSGAIPMEWTNLRKVRHLWLDDNVLQGNPTTVLNAMESMEMLYLGSNHLMSDMDETFMNKAVNLTVLDVSGNNFTGSYGLPIHLLRHPSLMILDLGHNQLQGPIPSDIPVNDRLLLFSAHANQLSGTIPSQIKNFNALLHLDLTNNKLVGPLPDEIFQITTLQNLFLGENNFKAGSLPIILEGMTHLFELSLKKMNRFGPLPKLIGFNNLTLLDLDHNDFTGTIPSSYADLPQLRYLLLNHNPQLTGTIPVIQSAALLEVVLLDATRVAGDFSSLCNVTAFQNEWNAVSAHSIVVVQCDEEYAITGCSCCHCCNLTEAIGCADPIVASLDWSWESGAIRRSRDFAINRTNLVDPKEW